MKAAVVTAAGQIPTYTDFAEPAAKAGEELIRVRAAALTHLTKGRASGAHYSSSGEYPAVAGVDGVGETADGRRVYFILPRAPFGALAERCPARASNCIVIPETLDDVAAAALANPGMSAWAALVERARLIAGDTVLVNGATGSAGRIAVQLARYLGAARVIATGRNQPELDALKVAGADHTVTLPTPGGVTPEAFDEELTQVFRAGVNVVVDYLWGESARALVAAIARHVEDASPVRFVQVGAASGQDSIDLPAAALRSSPIVLMGSGLKSVPLPTLLQGIHHVFEAAAPARLNLATRAVPLEQVREIWDTAPGTPRVVFTLP